MKIECPSCHLTGTINEVELPDQGRRLTCPRCKGEFYVEKPAPPASRAGMMNSCPACQYSTFTDEMFAVCPKCGMTAENYQAVARKQKEREQAARDQEALNRSFRNPDLVTPATELSATVPAKATQPVEVVGGICLAVGAALLFYGVTGLLNYYSRDWQAELAEQVLVPVSKLSVFFKLGLIPWLVTLFSLHLAWSAYSFAKVRDGALQWLTQSAWAGVAVAVLYEMVAFVEWVRVSSSTPTLSYYAVGILSSLFVSALLAAPFLVLLWQLQSDRITRAFRKVHLLSRNDRNAT